MLLVIILTTLVVVMLLPIEMKADVHYGERKLLRLQAEAAGLQRQWLLEASTGPGGLKLMMLNDHGKPRVLAPNANGARFATKLLRTLGKAPHLRQLILRQMKPSRLDVQLLLHVGDAAATALAAGIARGAASVLPRGWRAILRLRIQPDFLSLRSALQARCIFRIRLGMIALTAFLLLAAFAAQAIKREAKTWNTPSEN